MAAIHKPKPEMLSSVEKSLIDKNKECHKEGGHFVNGKCFLEPVGNQECRYFTGSQECGYAQQQQSERFARCDLPLPEKRARIRALQLAIQRACGPQGNLVDCDILKDELQRLLLSPDCM